MCNFVVFAQRIYMMYSQLMRIRIRIFFYLLQVNAAYTALASDEKVVDVFNQLVFNQGKSHLKYLSKRKTNRAFCIDAVININVSAGVRHR